VIFLNYDTGQVMSMVFRFCLQKHVIIYKFFLKLCGKLR